jgi:hypothetical protein
MKFLKFLTKSGQREVENSEEEFNKALNGFKSTVNDIDSLRQELKLISEEVYERASGIPSDPPVGVIPEEKENGKRGEQSGIEVPTFRIVRSTN